MLSANAYWGTMSPTRLGAKGTTVAIMHVSTGYISMKYNFQNGQKTARKSLKWIPRIALALLLYHSQDHVGAA